jgi:NAD(P) transhydrogenase subunit beta
MGVLAVTLAAVNVFGGFLVATNAEMFRTHARDVPQEGPCRREGAAGEIMSLNLVTLLYLVASVCFIQALKGLSHPTTSIRGNLFGMIGMAIAALTTGALIWTLSTSAARARMGGAGAAAGRHRRHDHGQAGGDDQDARAGGLHALA